MFLTIELEKFLQIIELPDGFRFREYEDEGILHYEADGGYFDSHTFRIENIETGMCVAIEVTGLRRTEGRAAKVAATILVKDIAQALTVLSSHEPNTRTKVLTPERVAELNRLMEAN